MKKSIKNNSALWIYKKTNKYISKVKRSRKLAKAIFNVDVPKSVTLHYDTTTLLVRRVLKAQKSNPGKLLEMGIGYSSLVNIGYGKENHVKVYGADISPEKVDSSKTVAKINKVSHCYTVSDLFNNIEGKFDCIVFNPPYIPAETGRSLKITEQLQISNELAWNGGEKGTEILQKFLEEASEILQPRGNIYIGVQDMYVDQDEFTELLNLSSLRQVRAHKRFYIPMTTVYELIAK